jgi:myo-inositol-1(or 4)-monophosphatase
MLELLEQLFRQVRAFILSDQFDRSKVYSKVAGHTTMQFDREAEDIIINGLIASGYGFAVTTEERPSFTTSRQPRYRIVIDPIDGSTNVKRGIMTAAVALAVLPIDVPILPENVQWALVGDLFTSTVYQAERGHGALRDGKRCSVSETRTWHTCLTGMNFDGRQLDILRNLLTRRPTPAMARRSGSAAMDIVYVASGAYDACIDIGNLLSAESFLASTSIVLEAGGIVSDEKGNPLRPIHNLSEGYSLVIAGTRELHKEILQRIAQSQTG